MSKYIVYTETRYHNDGSEIIMSDTDTYFIEAEDYEDAIKQAIRYETENYNELRLDFPELCAVPEISVSEMYVNVTLPTKNSTNL